MILTLLLLLLIAFIYINIIIINIVTVVDGKCHGQKLKSPPSDPLKSGAYNVGCGFFNVSNDGSSSLVYFPSANDAQKTSAYAFDLRQSLPDSWANAINGSNIPFLLSTCSLQNEIDKSGGPYPVIIALHHDGGMPFESDIQWTHLASRGFIVVAPTVSAAWMKTRIADLEYVAPAIDKFNVTQLYADKVAGVIAGLASVFPAADLTRIGVIGQGYGGGDSLALLTDDFFASVNIGMSNRPSVLIAAATDVQIKTPTSNVASIAFLGGALDTVITATEQANGYTSSITPVKVGKRLVIIGETGHHLVDLYCSYKSTMTPPGLFLGTFTPAGLNYTPIYGSASGWATDGCPFNPILSAAGTKVLSESEAGAAGYWVFSSVMEETLQCSTAASKNMYHISKLEIPISQTQSAGNARSLGSTKGASTFPWWGTLIIVVVCVSLLAMVVCHFMKKRESSGHV